jgi:hypothetical protein
MHNGVLKTIRKTLAKKRLKIYTGAVILSLLLLSLLLLLLSSSPPQQSALCASLIQEI